MAAQLGIVTDDPLTYLHALYSRANIGNLSSKFVTWNKRESGEEFPLMDV